MKLKTSTSKQPKHTNAVTCVCWSNTEEVFSCGDDHKLIKWNQVTGENFVVSTFPDDVYPTSMSIFPRIAFGSSRQNDILLISSADGKFHLVNQNGRIEKSVSAHQGACLTAIWSSDGAGFLTAGEDGSVKIWSKSGLLRSSLIQSEQPCYSSAWSPDSSAILYTKGNSLVIRQLNSSTKVLKWKAHDMLILAVAWNSHNNLILSGGEDGLFKIWDPFGQPISCSVKHEQPISAVSWSPSGDMLAVGSFNLIRLCNSNGWSYCLDRPKTGTLNCIAWSTDGTQLSAACNNMNVLFAHIIDRHYSWKNYRCSLKNQYTINMKDILSDQSDILEYSDRVTQVEFGCGHLIVTTTKQCYIHPMNSWNTPVVLDLKDGTVSVVLLAERCLCIVERTSIVIYSYNGRLLATPKWSNMRTDSIGRDTISLGPDCIVVVDQVDKRLIHTFELPTGLVVRSNTDHNSVKLTHKMSINKVALSQTGSLNDRVLAIIDYNKDLYVAVLKDSKIESRTTQFNKLGSQILDIMWSYDTELLIGLRLNSVAAWCCPKSNQPDWLNQTTIVKEISEIGRNPCISGYVDGSVQLSHGNGSIMHISLSPFPEKLLKQVASNQWQNALKLCRTVEDHTLWACLAVLAWQFRELDVAEEAFALINDYPQLEYIQNLKNSVPVKLPNQV